MVGTGYVDISSVVLLAHYNKVHMVQIRGTTFYHFIHKE